MAAPLSQEIRSAIGDRLRMMTDELRSFQANRQAGVYRKCLSNLYYACFHAASTLLEARGITAKTHEGVNSLFAAHFVKAGPFDRRFTKVLSKLEGLRQAADYQGYVEFDEQDVAEALGLAVPFLQQVINCLKAQTPEVDTGAFEEALTTVLVNRRSRHRPDNGG